MPNQFPVVFQPHAFLGNLKSPVDEPTLPDGVLYEAAAYADGLTYTLQPGALAEAAYLTADFLVSSDDLVVFNLRLFEDEGDDLEADAFSLQFSVLPHAQARLRMPIEAMNLNRWALKREGALLKPLCYGQRVDPAKVVRAALTIERKSPRPVHWCMTPLCAVGQAPALIDKPRLPKGKLVDELGQATWRSWAGKVTDAQQMVDDLHRRLDAAQQADWPGSFNAWGGWTQKSFEATGFFRVQREGVGETARWWLVDPDGGAFWSAGVDCIRIGRAEPVDGLEDAFTWIPGADGDAAFADAYAINPERGQHLVGFHTANLIRAFGHERWYEVWKTLTIGQLRSMGFNTIGNWSDPKLTQGGAVPYVRPLELNFPRTPSVFRDLPDVFDANFEADAHDFARQLSETAEDPAMIGYFLMNEPKWGFASQTPAEGMLLNTEGGASREALCGFLREQYADDAALAAAWGEGVTFANVTRGRWNCRFTDAALKDLAAFSSILADRFFGTLSRACREVDPNHMNLGIRFHTVPPDWAIAGMKHFDVFSINSYSEVPPTDKMQQIAELVGVPVMIGEWHFGALDAGLPASGIGHVSTQAERGKAYRRYLETAAACPYCVGVHYFQWYDQPALGRFDGENYQIGVIDVCHQPYEALAEAARQCHEVLYDVASGAREPWDGPVKYLPRLF